MVRFRVALPIGVVRVFSGCDDFCHALEGRGLRVSRPFDAHPPRGTYVAACDLDRLEVRQRLTHDIKCGLLRYVHFNLPYPSWASASVHNNSTRRTSCPLGGYGGRPLLSMEIRRNFQLAYVVAFAC